MPHKNIKIFGKVQEVFFRDSVKEKAGLLNLKGFARNEPDGTVYIEVEGEELPIQKFIEWCSEGPPLAGVKKVEVQTADLKNFEKFVIE